ncbi:MAG: hypothetical protein ACK40O_12675 [Allosphingosinicella sp.]
MRTFVISAILLSSVAVAAPASAQYRGGGYGHQPVRNANIERQIDQIEDQIDRMRDRRLISRSEAKRLERRAENIDRLHDRYRRGGLDRHELRDLQNRIHALRQDLRAERREGRYADRRDDRRGW